MRALIAILPFNTVACCLSVMICIGCKVEQVTNPSSVSVDILQPIESTGVDTGGSPPPSQPVAVSILLSPTSVEGVAPSSVWVLVIVRDANGTEIPSANITVSGLDTSVVQFNRREGRQLNFSLVAAGAATAIITASGAQATLVFTVN